MESQLHEIRSDFEAATARLGRLDGALAAAAWRARPQGGGWAPAECLAHLNLTSERFLPLMREALARAEPLPAGSDRRLRRDFLGWLLWRIMPPPVRLVRSRTSADFEPPPELDPPELVRRFGDLQQAQLSVVEQAQGLAIDRVQIASPFNARAKYNLFACLGILARHQHRHLWQAERAAGLE